MLGLPLFLQVQPPLKVQNLLAKSLSDLAGLTGFAVLLGVKFYQGPHWWADLPSDTRNMTDLGSFKSSIKDFCNQNLLA